MRGCVGLRKAPEGIPASRTLAQPNFANRLAGESWLASRTLRGLASAPRMRRFSAIFVLFAWLLASGAQWDLLQSFAWGRMIANYSRTMPLQEAMRLTFTPDNLCDVCAFIAENKTREATDRNAADHAPADSGTKAKAPIAPPPRHLFVLQVLDETDAAWPREIFAANGRARPAPPAEPPRAA